MSRSKRIEYRRCSGQVRDIADLLALPQATPERRRDLGRVEAVQLEDVGSKGGNARRGQQARQELGPVGRRDEDAVVLDPDAATVPLAGGADVNRADRYRTAPLLAAAGHQGDADRLPRPLGDDEPVPDEVAVGIKPAFGPGP